MPRASVTPAAAAHAVQRRLGLALRSRVAGDNAPEAAARIWGAEGERWFTPDDPIWRVNQDAAMFPGGIAALLLQSLHPSAMAGVAGHSGYKGDPWGRLQRTSHYLAVTTFGTIADAEQAIAHVRSVHRRVRGTDELGRPYAADDPHLLRWVHVAEIWSFLNAFQAYASDTLSAVGGRPVRRADQPRGDVARCHRPAHHRAGARRGHRRLSTRAREHRGGSRGNALHAPEPAGPARRSARLRPDRSRRSRAAADLGPQCVAASGQPRRDRSRLACRWAVDRPRALGDGRAAGAEPVR